ncbi:MAG TPA: tetratricopeptide repeat protein [Rhizomicrobium sp.]|jgi:cytochrome c-type biogenesis protein CcmH
MRALVFLIFSLLILSGAAFAAWPVLRRRNQPARARFLLAGAVGLLVTGIGGGVYLMLGHPELAARSIGGGSASDVSSLVAPLVQKVRQNPDDPRGWAFLGRTYLSLNDPADAAAALRRGIAVAPPGARAQLYSAFGEAETLASGGNTPPDAEAAFSLALAANPKDNAARFYLGQLYASRNDRARALALWQSLLADTPPNAPWRAALVDRMAMLTGRGGAAPDIGLMVQSLAARLQLHPDDPEGWQRLIRSYAVLGDKEKAVTALAEARRALKENPAALAQLAREAEELKLRK